MLQCKQTTSPHQGDSQANPKKNDEDIMCSISTSVLYMNLKNQYRDIRYFLVFPTCSNVQKLAVFFKHFSLSLFISITNWLLDAHIIHYKSWKWWRAMRVEKILQYMCPGHHYREKPQRTIIFYPNLVALKKNALFPGSVIGLINWLAVWWTVVVGWEERRWNYTVERLLL